MELYTIISNSLTQQKYEDKTNGEHDILFLGTNTHIFLVTKY